MPRLNGSENWIGCAYQTPDRTISSGARRAWCQLIWWSAKNDEARFVCFEVIDMSVKLAHFSTVKSLLEIEEAIAKLPPKARRQLVQDIPALCPGEFPADGWDAILNDAAPRSALSSLLDKLDAEHSQSPENFLVLNDKSLRSKK